MPEHTKKVLSTSPEGEDLVADAKQKAMQAIREADELIVITLRNGEEVSEVLACSTELRLFAAKLLLWGLHLDFEDTPDKNSVH